MASVYQEIIKVVFVLEGEQSVSFREIVCPVASATATTALEMIYVTTAPMDFNLNKTPVSALRERQSTPMEAVFSAIYLSANVALIKANACHA